MTDDKDTTDAPDLEREIPEERTVELSGVELHALRESAQFAAIDRQALSPVGESSSADELSTPEAGEASEPAALVEQEKVDTRELEIPSDDELDASPAARRGDRDEEPADESTRSLDRGSLKEIIKREVKEASAEDGPAGFAILKHTATKRPSADASSSGERAVGVDGYAEHEDDDDTQAVDHGLLDQLRQGLAPDQIRSKGFEEDVHERITPIIDPIDAIDPDELSAPGDDELDEGSGEADGSSRAEESSEPTRAEQPGEPAAPRATEPAEADLEQLAAPTLPELTHDALEGSASVAAERENTPSAESAADSDEFERSFAPSRVPLVLVLLGLVAVVLIGLAWTRGWFG